MDGTFHIMGTPPSTGKRLLPCNDENGKRQYTITRKQNRLLQPDR